MNDFRILKVLSVCGRSRVSQLRGCVQAIAQALLEGNCFSTTVATSITAVTGADFEVIEGCERGDFAAGDASGSTDGSTAEGVRSCSPDHQPSYAVPPATPFAAMVGG